MLILNVAADRPQNTPNHVFRAPQDSAWAVYLISSLSRLSRCSARFRVAETGITARLEPATIDGLVYASSMVVLYAARHRVPVPSLARWLLALGIATLTANMA